MVFPRFRFDPCPACCPCPNCSWCASNQDEFLLTLAGFTDFPNGDYILTCHNPCNWENTLEGGSACGVDLIELNAQSYGWQIRLIDMGPPFDLYKVLFILNSLTPPYDCQPNLLDIPLVEGHNACGGGQFPGDVTATLSAIL